MGYCTLTDIMTYVPERELIETTDDTNTGEVNASLVDTIISDASELVDGYLSALYSVPLADVSKLIKSITVDIAVYLLYSRRLSLEMPDSLSARYKNALNLLEKIRKGEISLGMPTATTESTPASAVVSNRRTRIFSDL